MYHNTTTLSAMTNATSSHCELLLKDTAGPPPEYGFTATILLTSVLVLVPLLTILGNSFTILVVLTHRKLKTTTNAFIASLATADLCVALLVMPFAIYQQANNKVWTLGDTVCRLSASFDVMMCTVSIFHLSSMAIDRYLAICRPFLHQRMTAHMVTVILVLCWVTPIFLSFLPIMNGWNEVGIEDFLFCAFPPEVQACVFMVNIPFAVICSLIAFYIPVVFMGVCNVKIYLAARRQVHLIHALEEAATGTHTSQHKGKKFRNETKAAKTLGIIMACFSVCWFPFFIFNIIDPFIGYRIPYIPWMVVLWLGYINSMMNPLMYFFFNRIYRAAFQRLLYCMVCKGERPYDSYTFNFVSGVGNTGVPLVSARRPSSHHDVSMIDRQTPKRRNSTDFPSCLVPNPSSEVPSPTSWC